MPAMPACKCGNQTNFILREIHRTTGTFRIEEGHLFFKPQHDTADLERDAVVCNECCVDVETEDFDVD